MKRIILTALAVMAFGVANAQDGHFKIGAHVGLPLGDTADAFSTNVGVDAAYLWNVANKFSAGITSGYTVYLGKSLEYNAGSSSFDYSVPNSGFIPVAGTAQYSLTDSLFLGADLGYAIFVGSEDKPSGQSTGGGFLYQPKFGYQNEKIELFASYKSISNNGSLHSLNIGFNYKF
jgi:hypothetical protein